MSFSETCVLPAHFGVVSFGIADDDDKRIARGVGLVGFSRGVTRSGKWARRADGGRVAFRPLGQDQTRCGSSLLEIVILLGDR